MKETGFLKTKPTALVTLFSFWYYQFCKYWLPSNETRFFVGSFFYFFFFFVLIWTYKSRLINKISNPIKRSQTPVRILKLVSKWIKITYFQNCEFSFQSYHKDTLIRNYPRNNHPKKKQKQKEKLCGDVCLPNPSSTGRIWHNVNFLSWTLLIWIQSFPLRTVPSVPITIGVIVTSYSTTFLVL